MQQRRSIASRSPAHHHHRRGLRLRPRFRHAGGAAKLPALVGYLLAGVVIGPFSPGFVADSEIASQLAEIGVMLLMFGVGLHFSLEDFWDVRRIAVPGAIILMSIATAIGVGFGLLWGWGLGGALVFGLALSVASTVVTLKAMEARGVVETVSGRIAVGWLIVEDLAMVLVLVLLPPLSGALGGKGVPMSAPDIYLTLEITLAKIGAFVAVMLIVGKRAFPWLLWQVARTGSRELFTLCVVAAAVSLAFGAAELFGVSFALGAFLAGMVINESEFSARAARRIAAAARRLRGAVLRLRRHVVRSLRADPFALAGARRRRHRHDRQSADRGGHRAVLSLSAQRRAHDCGEPRADRRILLHSGRAWHEPRAFAAGRPESHSGRRADLDHAEFACLPAIAPIEAWLLSIPALARLHQTPRRSARRAADGDGG